MVSLALWVYNKRNLISFGFCWFFIALLPRVAFFAPSTELVGDYKTFLGSIGMMVMLAGIAWYVIDWLCSNVLHIESKIGWSVVSIAGCWGVVTLLGTTKMHVDLCQNPVAFWQREVAHTPQHARNFYYLANALQAQQETQAAVDAYQRAVVLDEAYADPLIALGEIYRRPQFSGYNANESDRCFDRAADLGHAQAQFRRGATLWRKREKIQEKVQGLQASYWIWQAHQQGVSEAKELLGKVLEKASSPMKNDWYELAGYAEKALDRHAEYQLNTEWILLCHRLIVANQFNFSKAELLLCEAAKLQHEHCVVVDIRHKLPKILPRLIQIDTTQQRRSLLAAGKVFASIESDQEGNLRQRRYRFDRLTEWLKTTFSQN
jgi:hypothetical protein